MEAAGANQADVIAFAETGLADNEIRFGPEGPIEYRYADLALALGEAVMVNHALFAGLLQAGATPISDHLQQARQRLAAMARRIRQEPWTTDFAAELEHQTIPYLMDELNPSACIRNSLLQSNRSLLAPIGCSTGSTAAPAPRRTGCVICCGFDGSIEVQAWH